MRIEEILRTRVRSRRSTTVAAIRRALGRRVEAEVTMELHVLADIVHSDHIVLIAYSKASRMLMVVYAERDDGAIIRIISARRATAHEKALHEEES
jgi:uncharacterized DUF497 family protein